MLNEGRIFELQHYMFEFGTFDVRFQLALSSRRKWSAVVT